MADDRPRRRLSGGLPAAQGRYGLIAAIAIDSLGTGLFLPFTVLYFIHTTPLSATAIGTALSSAPGLGGRLADSRRRPTPPVRPLGSATLRADSLAGHRRPPS